MICPACNRDIAVDSAGMFLRHRRTRNSKQHCENSGPTVNAKKKPKRKPSKTRVHECPTHHVVLVAQQTKWGVKWYCPAESCTVALWNGYTSTPADSKTRRARQRAHKAFDPLWKQHGWPRGHLYRVLAVELGIEEGRCHIGMFDSEQCDRVVEFCRTFNQLESAVRLAVAKAAPAIPLTEVSER